MSDIIVNSRDCVYQIQCFSCFYQVVYRPVIACNGIHGFISYVIKSYWILTSTQGHLGIISEAERGRHDILQTIA